MIDQPTFNASKADFDGVTAIGDIGFDVGYGISEPSGFIWAYGMVGTLPTATDSNVGGKQWRFGPELLIAKFEKWGVYGFFPSHQWDVGGWSDKDFSNTQIQLFLSFLPGGSWTYGSNPIMNYDWESEEWTVPVHVTVGKTVNWGVRPVKLAVEANYYVEQGDAFCPDWMIGINVTPVVNNFIDSWAKGL